jgi:hypothetical protein
MMQTGQILDASIMKAAANTRGIATVSNATTVPLERSEHKVVLIGSPFIRTGSITMENQVLRISYDTFGTFYTAFIGTRDLQKMVRDRFAPASPVMQMRTGIDGAEVTEKIGYACRSVSGKALKISTSTSGGDLIVPWTRLLQVVNCKVRLASISRLNKCALECPGPSLPASRRSIRENLTGVF